MQAGQSPGHPAHQSLHVTEFPQIPEWHCPQGLLTKHSPFTHAMQQKLTSHLTRCLLTDPGSPLP
jgi:hypothetical protein